MEYTHVIVGGPRLREGNIKYRRQRLLEYLVSKPETAIVYWIYFNPKSEKLPGTLDEPELPSMYREEPFNKISQIEISDFKTLIAFLKTGQLLLKKRVLNCIPCHGRSILWYTMQHFANLIEFKKWDLVVYDCSDNWTGNYESGNWLKSIWSRMAERSEKQIIQNSDIQFATSIFLKNKIDQIEGTNCHLIENGYDQILFGKNNFGNDKRPSIPRLCFIGTLREKKVDIALLANLMKSRPKWELWIVGPSENMENNEFFEELKYLKNVHFQGTVSSKDVPEILSKVDIGILPGKDSEFNKGVFPIKFYEYMAAGLPIVACNLPSLHRFREEEIIYYSNGKVTDFIEKCEQAYNKGIYYKIYKNILSAATWQKKFDQLYNKVLHEI